MDWLDDALKPSKVEPPQDNIAPSGDGYATFQDQSDLSAEGRENHPLWNIIEDKDRWNDLMTDRSIRDAETPLDKEMARLGYFEKLFPDLPNRTAEDGTILTPVSPGYREAVVAILSPTNLEKLNATDRQKLDARIDLHVERAKAAHMANTAKDRVGLETDMQATRADLQEVMMQEAGRTPPAAQSLERGGPDR